MGDLIAVFIQQGYVEDGLEFVVIVIPDIGIGPLRLEETITLLPDADRVGFNPRQIFQIFNGKCVHTIYNKV
jgi:hypothetical protein